MKRTLLGVKCNDFAQPLITLEPVHTEICKLVSPYLWSTSFIVPFSDKRQHLFGLVLNLPDART